MGSFWRQDTTFGLVNQTVWAWYISSSVSHPDLNQSYSIKTESNASSAQSCQACICPRIAQKSNECQIIENSPTQISTNTTYRNWLGAFVVFWLVTYCLRKLSSNLRKKWTCVYPTYGSFQCQIYKNYFSSSWMSCSNYYGNCWLNSSVWSIG